MIVRMMHLDLVCVAAEKDAALEKLRALGAVHLDLGVAAGAAVSAAKGEIEDAEKAVRLVLKARGKDFSEEIRPRTVKEILALDEDRATLVTEKERLEREIKIYAPYGDFDPALAKKLIDRGIDLKDELPAKLPEMRLAKMQEKLSRVENRIAVDTAKIAMSDEKAVLGRYPALREQMEFEQARELMAAQGAVSVISGWIPETKVTGIREQGTGNGWGMLIREPAEGEVPPTLINPPKFVKPVKALFEGLGIAPAYDEADVSVPFMCYFSLFFAMLVGDGAYGAIFLIGTLWAWRKWKVRSSKSGGDAASPLGSWFVLMTVFSLATIAWGALSNTWFGAGIPWCSDWPTVRWLSGAGAPAGHEYDNIMFLCFTIGVTHLMLARIWNGIVRINDRSCLREFGWAGIVLFMYILTNTIIGIFPGIPVWAYWMFGVSFLTVFASVKGVEKGMLFLNTMSALGDVISYVRLFAVGLASVKVAENFNGMAISIFNSTDALWVKPLLAIAMVLVLLAGHALNIAMAGLSILVHAVRLNTLEFSNHKGVTWAGYAFRPFKTRKGERK